MPGQITGVIALIRHVRRCYDDLERDTLFFVAVIHLVKKRLPNSTLQSLQILKPNQELLKSGKYTADKNRGAFMPRISEYQHTESMVLKCFYHIHVSSKCTHFWLGHEAMCTRLYFSVEISILWFKTRLLGKYIINRNTILEHGSVTPALRLSQLSLRPRCVRIPRPVYHTECHVNHGL